MTTASYGPLTQIASTYLGHGSIAAAANIVTALIGVWLIVSFLWFVINLFCAPKGLYLNQQERAQKEFDDQTKLINQ